MADTAIIKDGVLMDSSVKQKLFSGLEHGPLANPKAIVLHQTGGSTAEGTLSGYANNSVGAHFLIDKDGTIYQTCRVDRIAYHVGPVRSKCYETKSCEKDEQKKVTDILFKKGVSYGQRTLDLAQHEYKKDYGDRYPVNSDSLGIEVVGALIGNKYETPTAQQTASVKWLVAQLMAAFSIGEADVYKHPIVSYKQLSEAEAVEWK